MSPRQHATHLLVWSFAAWQELAWCGRGTSRVMLQSVSAVSHLAFSERVNNRERPAELNLPCRE